MIRSIALVTSAGARVTPAVEDLAWLTGRRAEIHWICALRELSFARLFIHCSSAATARTRAGRVGFNSFLPWVLVVVWKPGHVSLDTISSQEVLSGTGNEVK